MQKNKEFRGFLNYYQEKTAIFLILILFTFTGRTYAGIETMRSLGVSIGEIKDAETDITQINPAYGIELKQIAWTIRPVFYQYHTNIGEAGKFGKFSNFALQTAIFLPIFDNFGTYIEIGSGLTTLSDAKWFDDRKFVPANASFGLWFGITKDIAIGAGIKYLYSDFWRKVGDKSYYVWDLPGISLIDHGSFSGFGGLLLKNLIKDLEVSYSLKFIYDTPKLNYYSNDVLYEQTDVNDNIKSVPLLDRVVYYPKAWTHYLNLRYNFNKKNSLENLASLSHDKNAIELLFSSIYIKQYKYFFAIFGIKFFHNEFDRDHTDTFKDRNDNINVLLGGSLNLSYWFTVYLTLTYKIYDYYESEFSDNADYNYSTKLSMIDPQPSLGVRVNFNNDWNIEFHYKNFSYRNEREPGDIFIKESKFMFQINYKLPNRFEKSH